MGGTQQWEDLKGRGWSLVCLEGLTSPFLFLIFFSVCKLADNLWVSVLSPCAFWGSSLGVRRRQQALLIELSQEPHYFFKVFFFCFRLSFLLRVTLWSEKNLNTHGQNSSGGGGMAQWIKCLLRTHEDPSLDPQHPHKVGYGNAYL